MATAMATATTTETDDPCKLAKKAVCRASGEEGKGCDEFTHPLSGVTDKGEVLGGTSTVVCEYCGKVVNLYIETLVPVTHITGDGDTIVEFKITPRGAFAPTGGEGTTLLSGQPKQAAGIFPRNIRRSSKKILVYELVGIVEFFSTYLL